MIESQFFTQSEPELVTDGGINTRLVTLIDGRTARIAYWMWIIAGQMVAVSFEVSELAVRHKPEFERISAIAKLDLMNYVKARLVHDPEPAVGVGIVRDHGLMPLVKS